MAPDAGTDRDALIERLTASGNQFDFVQAMSLLEAVSGDGAPPGEAGPLAREALRLRSNPELGFPPGDLHAIRRREGKPERFEVVLNFMGLSGVSSPLPAYFTDMVAKQLEGGEPMREFLAIFEHRFYSLFWRAWKKYRLDLALDRMGEQRRTRFLVGVSGFSLPALAESPAIEPLRLAGFAGLVGVARTSAAGLRNLVAGYFGGLPVRVLEFVPRRVFVPNRAGLGGDGGMGSARLCDTALVGDTVLDRAAMVRVVIGPLSLAHYHAMLPGGDWSRALAELVRLALPAEFEFQVQLVLKHDEVPPCRLGDADARLGWLSWLGRPAGDGESAPMSAAAFAVA